VKRKVTGSLLVISSGLTCFGLCAADSEMSPKKNGAAMAVAPAANAADASDGAPNAAGLLSKQQLKRQAKLAEAARKKAEREAKGLPAKPVWNAPNSKKGQQVR
jgi:hypothetical protein